jgi:Cys-rich four helix bundle protein (predicted Tat secretion target)
MGDGDKSVAGCARSVSETLALCESLRKLVAQDSKHAKAVARIAMTACMDCEKECQKHAKLHKECRDCAAACLACARECKAYAA